MVRKGVRVATPDGGPGRPGLGKAKLLAAARLVIAEHGVEGIRVRRLAATAGVSAPLVSYHYPDQADLVLHVHRDLVDDYFGHRAALVREAEDAIEQLRACARAGLPPGVDPELIAPLFELHGLARRDAAHAEIMSNLWVSEHALYARIISAGQRAGVFAPDADAERVAASLLALEDGLALHIIGRNSAIEESWPLRNLLRVAALELGCAQLELAD